MELNNNNKNLNMMIIQEWLEPEEYAVWNMLITTWGDPFFKVGEQDEQVAEQVASEMAHLIETARGRWLNYKQGATLVRANRDCLRYKDCECPKCRSEGDEGSPEDTGSNE